MEIYIKVNTKLDSLTDLVHTCGKMEVYMLESSIKEANMEKDDG
jgi:hypothetical protein